MDRIRDNIQYISHMMMMIITIIIIIIRFCSLF